MLGERDCTLVVEVREETDVELFDLVAIECGIESTAADLRFVRGVVAVAFTCCLFPFPFEGLCSFVLSTVLVVLWTGVALAMLVSVAVAGVYFLAAFVAAASGGR